MPAPVRSTRRAPAPASARFHAARRSSAVSWLLGGIGGAFALGLAFVLVGGSPPIDTFPDRVAELEAKAHRLEDDGRREEAIRAFQELQELVGGRETYRTRAMDWRAAVKRLQAEAVDIRKADALFAAFAKEVDGATPSTARALLERGERLRADYAQSKRPWLATLDALLDNLRGLLPKPKPTPPSVEVQVEARAWSTAARILRDYLKLDVEPTDRRKAENTLRSVEQKAREEAVPLVKRGLPPDALRAQLPRFLGTAAEEMLRKAVDGK
jgi:hypothetical protein